jgi:hypothetical protein
MTPHAAVVAAGYKRSNATRTLRRLLLRPDVSAALTLAAQRKANDLAHFEEIRRLAVRTKDAQTALRAVELRREILRAGL